jgi:hypothetical protein
MNYNAQGPYEVDASGNLFVLTWLQKMIIFSQLIKKNVKHCILYDIQHVFIYSVLP